MRRIECLIIPSLGAHPEASHFLSIAVYSYVRERRLNGIPSSLPGPSIAPDQFSQLMEAIASSQTRMEHRFAEFRDEVCQGQEDAASKALKRAKFEKPYISSKGQQGAGNIQQPPRRDRGRGRDRAHCGIVKHSFIIHHSDYQGPGMSAERSVASRRATEADSYCGLVGAWVGSSGGIYG